MNFFIMVSLFLSAALGVFRGIDLALLTDAETGLCIVGSVWLRYGALAVAVGAAVAAGRCCKPQAGALRGHCTPSGVVALAAAVCYGEAAVLRILWMGSSVAMLIRAALEALCAFWMIGLGLSWLRKDWKTPTRSLTPAVLGSVIGLAVGSRLLDGTGAIRVHGGGFAGTIQAFVPLERLERFRAGMEVMLGQGKCHVLRIRPQGGCVVAE